MSVKGYSVTALTGNSCFSWMWHWTSGQNVNLSP